MPERFSSGINIRGTYTIDTVPGAIDRSFLNQANDAVRSAATKAFNIARKNIQEPARRLIMEKIMNHPHVQELSAGTGLVYALGLASPEAAYSAVEKALDNHLIGKTEGAGRGLTPEGKGTVNKMPRVRFGMTERGKEGMAEDPGGFYTSRSSKVSQINWLMWMLYPKERGWFSGYHVSLGDYPKSRTGGAIMKPHGRFGISSAQANLFVQCGEIF